MKQTRLWLTTIAVLLCGISANAHDFEVDGIYYEITSSTNLTVAVTYQGYYSNTYSNEYSGSVIIPSTVPYNGDNYSVTTIGSDAFKGCSSLTSITIPEGVTSIEMWAFQFCSGLTSVNMSEGVSTIGPEAFNGCSSLTSITIPESVTTIQSGAFYGCSSLASINIPKNVKDTDFSFLFYGCSNLTSITIPEGVTSIGNNAFNNCCSLTSITIPESVTSIGDQAFYGCSGLTSITIPESVTSIGKNAFYQCAGELIVNCNIPSGAFLDSKFTKVIFGNKITTIEWEAFKNCSNITSLNLPEGITTIGGCAFENCSGLECTYIPSSVESIGNEAFKGCPGELTVKCNIPRGAFANSNFNNVVIEEGVMSIGEGAFSNCQSLTSITIPESVTSIGSYAFSTCSSLTSITIPESVTSIDGGAFEGYTGNLTVKCNIPDGTFSGADFSNVTIGESVTSIGDRAFKECINLVAITIPGNVTSIGLGAFEGCSNLSSLTISNGVVSIHTEAFKGCDGLTSIIIPSSVTSFGYSVFSRNVRKVFWMGNTIPNTYGVPDNVTTYSVNSNYASKKGYKVYPLLSNMFEVDGITYVPTSMSERTCDVVNYDINRTTESVEVGASVSYRNIAFTVNNVNDNTFFNGKNIKEISLSNHGGIGAYAFENCTALASVELSESITSIGNYAFNKCGQLTSITFPASIASVGYAPFAQCDNLASISVKNGNTKYDSREECNAIIETETNKLVAACGNTAIPEGVTEIGDYAFVDCAGITSLNIRANINSIGDYAFSGCSGVTDVIIEDRTEVLTLGSNGDKALFADCPLDSVYIGGKIIYSTSSSKGYSPFYGNTSLRAVEITDHEEQIHDNEFYGCTDLTNVSIGNKISSIGAYAFSGCRSLKGFSFGSSMETIGAYAFTGCTNLESMTVHTVVPPICSTQALNDIDKWNCMLNVPKGYASAYQNADQWKEFLFVEDNVPIKRYAMTYMVNDTIVYHVDSLAYKEAIILPDDPIKEGHTFNGWEGVPETMPIHDVTVNALFTINKYVLSYVVDGEVHMADSITYGDSIVVIAPLEREGHTFSGWVGAPETMPAKDTTIVGSFIVNSYLLTYTIDGDTIQSDSVAYGSEITMLEAPVKAGYSFDGWDQVVAVMPAEDVVINGSYTRLPIENYVISDSDESFTLEEDLLCYKITYTRNFKNTNWQALYVPFEIPVENIKDDFVVAYINDVHQFDDDDNGTIDRTQVEAIKMTGGTLKANYPYMIRAKVAGEKTITVTDATLYAAEENSIDCSSVFDTYTFTGTYSKIPAAELPKEEGYYALSGGAWKNIAAGTSLGAFRMYMKIDSRDASASLQARAIEMRVIGDDGVTAIENVGFNTPETRTATFDMQGRRVENPTKGLYIIDGKKVWIK